MLEWVAFPFSRGSSWPRDQTQVSRIAGRFFTNWATREAFSLPKDVSIHRCPLYFKAATDAVIKHILGGGESLIHELQSFQIQKICHCLVCDANCDMSSLLQLFLMRHFYLKDNLALIPSLDYPSSYITSSWPLNCLHRNLNVLWVTSDGLCMEYLW